jgi:hypothetical protein
MKTLALIAVFLFALGLRAEEPVYFELGRQNFGASGVLAYEEEVVLPASGVISEVPQQRVVADAKFWAVVGALQGATVFDLHTTFRVIDAGGREKNPFMSPVINRGKGASYAYTTGLNAGTISLSYWLKRKKVKLWWLPAVAISATHVYAGFHNRQVYNDIIMRRR